MLLRAVIGVHVVAGAAAVIVGGLAMLARKGRGRHRRWGLAYLAALAVICLTAVPLAMVDWSHRWHLALLAAVAAGLALLGYLARPARRPGRFSAHIAGMGGAYIVMLTAFYVDNGPRLPLWRLLPPVVFWFLPAAVGGPIMVRALHRWRRPARRTSSTSTANAVDTRRVV